MSLIEKAGKKPSGTASGACPAWCVLDHSRNGKPVIILHESSSAVIEISGPREADVPEWIDVRTTQYSAEESGGLPCPPTIELSHYRGSRYRVTTLTPDEARRLAAWLTLAAGDADDL